MQNMTTFQTQLVIHVFICTELATELDIDDFCLTQFSLHDVFLLLADDPQQILEKLLSASSSSIVKNANSYRAPKGKSSTTNSI